MVFVLLVVINYAATFANAEEKLLSYLQKYVARYPKTCSELGVHNCSHCWGYEHDCPLKAGYSVPICPTDEKFKSSSADDWRYFWDNADFGFVKQVRKELQFVCSPLRSQPRDSYLVCSENMRFCKSRNVFMDFSQSDFQSEGLANGYARFKGDFLKPDSIGGVCRLNNSLAIDTNHKSALQSWIAELEHFTPVNTLGKCDVVIDKVTYVMKLDSGVNLYHHFCDFINLYISQHVFGSFDRDNNIIMWDTSLLPYRDIFREAWSAFTNNNDNLTIPLSSFSGKRVCFTNLVFSLLPRMQNGLYYNSYFGHTCQRSGLFNSFSRHFIDRMNVVERAPSGFAVRITILNRHSHHRRNRNIINLNDLVSKLRLKHSNFNVSVFEFKHDLMSFREQLEVIRNTDILIGMHGAGLTHMLFLPEWAVVFELYNCGDERCYRDLARLRGLEYVTWTDNSKITRKIQSADTSNPKFADYGFEVEEFVSKVQYCWERLKRNKSYSHLIDILDRKREL